MQHIDITNLMMISNLCFEQFPHVFIATKVLQVNCNRAYPILCIFSWNRLFKIRSLASWIFHLSISHKVRLIFFMGCLSFMVDHYSSVCIIFLRILSFSISFLFCVRKSLPMDDHGGNLFNHLGKYSGTRAFYIIFCYCCISFDDFVWANKLLFLNVCNWHACCYTNDLTIILFDSLQITFD